MFWVLSPVKSFKAFVGESSRHDLSLDSICCGESDKFCLILESVAKGVRGRSEHGSDNGIPKLSCFIVAGAKLDVLGDTTLVSWMGGVTDVAHSCGWCGVVTPSWWGVWLVSGSGPTSCFPIDAPEAHLYGACK